VTKRCNRWSDAAIVYVTVERMATEAVALATASVFNDAMGQSSQAGASQGHPDLASREIELKQPPTRT
jgi:hypothetical protein